MKQDHGVSPGQTIASKYRLVKMLGRGGMGTVWLADHLTLLSPVAVKIIKPQIAKNANSLARFMREAKAAAMLRSPHVVQILDHGTDGAIAFIVMELLEGESLLARLQREKRLPVGETAMVMTHVARAIQRAHAAGITHRDLKPDNIFLVENDDETIAKVLDFGIAKSAQLLAGSSPDGSSPFPADPGEGPRTQTGAMLGTPYYMSPEQAVGAKDIDGRSDLWAMGVIAYECLLGKRPFTSDSLGDLVLQICTRDKPIPSREGQVPEGFDAWFERATARDVTLRFQTAKELSRALVTVLRGDSTRPSTRDSTDSALTPASRDPTEPGGEAASAAAGAAAPARGKSGHDTAVPSTVRAPTQAGDTERAPLPKTVTASPADANSLTTPVSPAAADEQAGVADTVTPAELAPAAAASADHHDGGTLASSAPDLQTLDPLASTNAPRRRSLALGIAAGGTALGAGVIAALLVFGDAPIGRGSRAGAHSGSASTRDATTAGARDAKTASSSARGRGSRSAESPDRDTSASAARTSGSAPTPSAATPRDSTSAHSAAPNHVGAPPPVGHLPPPSKPPKPEDDTGI